MYARYIPEGQSERPFKEARMVGASTRESGCEHSEISPPLRAGVPEGVRTGASQAKGPAGRGADERESYGDGLSPVWKY